MHVVLQYFDGCPHWADALGLVRVALDDLGIDADVTLDVVTPDEEDRVRRFPGSPTLLVDGVDPFPAPEPTDGLSCRRYVTPEGLAGTPSPDQIRAALAEAAGRRGPSGESARGA